MTRSLALLAVGVGMANAVLMTGLGRRDRLYLGALDLAFIAGAYPGMALASTSSRATAQELIAAGPFLAFALAAIRRDSARTVGAGLVAHGAWDALHHGAQLGTQTPHGYPGFCCLADVLLAIPLIRQR